MEAKYNTGWKTTNITPRILLFLLAAFLLAACSKETALDSETAITLACHLSLVFTTARDWYGLAMGLAERGFGLKFEGARLVLTSEATGQSLCTCGSLGHSFASLLARLGKPVVLAETGQVITRPAR